MLKTKKKNPIPPFPQASFLKFATLPRDRKWHISKLATLPRAPYQPHATNNFDLWIVPDIKLLSGISGKFITSCPWLPLPSAAPAVAYLDDGISRSNPLLWMFFVPPGSDSSHPSLENHQENQDISETRTYPPVNVYISMENHHVSQVIKSTISMAIFHSSVSLPEGSRSFQDAVCCTVHLSSTWPVL